MLITDLDRFKAGRFPPDYPADRRTFYRIAHIHLAQLQAAAAKEGAHHVW